MMAKDYFEGECFNMAERPIYKMARRKAAEFVKNRAIVFNFHRTSCRNLNRDAGSADLR